MPFMQVEVSGPETWIEVDGPYGMEIVPCDVCGSIEDCDNSAEAWNQVSDYFENRECYTIDEVTGYSGRLSAPGYMDCTEWMGPYDSAEEARRAVIETFELCPACEDLADSPKSRDNPACNFYHY